MRVRLRTCPAVAVSRAAPVAAHDLCRGALPPTQSYKVNDWRILREKEMRGAKGRGGREGARGNELNNDMRDASTVKDKTFKNGN